MTSDKGLKTKHKSKFSEENNCEENIDLAINMLLLSFVRTIWSIGEGDGDTYRKTYMETGKDAESSSWVTRAELCDK